MTKNCPACNETLRQGLFKDMLLREYIFDRLMYGYVEGEEEQEKYLRGVYDRCVSGEVYFSETIKRVCTGLGWYDVQNSKQLMEKLKG